MQRRFLSFLLLLLFASSGCLDIFGRDEVRPTYEELGWAGDDVTGVSKADWPDLNKRTLSILVAPDGDWEGLDQAISKFETLTGATVEKSEANTYDALWRALEDDDDGPGADVVWGLDQAYLAVAREKGLVAAYTPQIGSRIDPLVELYSPVDSVFGVPAFHRYISINWDSENQEIERNAEIQRQAAANAGRPWPENRPAVQDLFDVRTLDNLTVVPDPTIDPVGRGFLLMTIAALGEDRSYYDWLDYWRDLFTDELASANEEEIAGNCVLITPSAEDARSIHFTLTAPAGTKPIMVGYTTDAMGMSEFTGGEASLVLGPNQTWHEVTTSAVVKKAPELAAAQAWTEFVLTEAFQNLVRDEGGAYPAVHTIPDGDIFAGDDPLPGTFRPAFISQDVLGIKLEQWLDDWSALRTNVGAC